MSEECLRASYAAVGQVMMAPDRRLLESNQAFCEITGYDETELLRTDIHSLIDPRTIVRKPPQRCSNCWMVRIRGNQSRSDTSGKTGPPSPSSSARR